MLGILVWATSRKFYLYMAAVKVRQQGCYGDYLCIPRKEIRLWEEYSTKGGSAYCCVPYFRFILLLSLSQSHIGPCQKPGNGIFRYDRWKLWKPNERIGHLIRMG